MRTWSPDSTNGRKSTWRGATPDAVNVGTDEGAPVRAAYLHNGLRDARDGCDQALILGGRAVEREERLQCGQLGNAGELAQRHRDALQVARLRGGIEQVLGERLCGGFFAHSGEGLGDGPAGRRPQRVRQDVVVPRQRVEQEGRPRPACCERARDVAEQHGWCARVAREADQDARHLGGGVGGDLAKQEPLRHRELRVAG